MSRQRRSWTPEEKAVIVLEIIREEGTLAEISRKHEIAQPVLSRWRTEFIENMAIVFDKKGESIDKVKKEYLYENAIRELIAVFKNNQSKVNWPLEMYGLGMVLFYIASWIMMIVIIYQVSKNFIHDYVLIAPIVLGFLVLMELISKIKRVRTTS